VYVFNDHITSFFFDNYAVFSLGIGEEYKVADEGGGARSLPAVPGNPELAAHIGASLVAEEFDMSFFQDKPLDHGFFSPMSVLLERTGDQWPTTLVPLQVGVVQFPIPSAARAGASQRCAGRSGYPEDIDVVACDRRARTSARRCSLQQRRGDSFLELITRPGAPHGDTGAEAPSSAAGRRRDRHVVDHARRALRQRAPCTAPTTCRR
jgi:hypothetical protein